MKMIAHATHRELAAQVQYLKVENVVLRSKLPKRITVTAAERARLVKFGKKCTCSSVRTHRQPRHPDSANGSTSGCQLAICMCQSF
ncbi:MAG: hypothetical protein WD800_08160 [Dehalococcoidia bacterium]